MSTSEEYSTAIAPKGFSIPQTCFSEGRFASYRRFLGTVNSRAIKAPTMNNLTLYTERFATAGLLLLAVLPVVASGLFGR
jgi:hypothetical protein